jgi:ABC-type dipeptide/oligopeptide/nickel transport system ATPase component
MQQTANSSEFKTKEKDSFELGLYDKKGYLNKSLLRAIGFWSFCFIWFIVIYASKLYNANKEHFFSLKWQENYLLELIEWFINSSIYLYDFHIHRIVDFLAILSFSMLISLALYIWLKRKVRARATIQSNLASLGLENYYMSKFDNKKRTIVFKLIQGERGNYDTFILRKEDLKQLFRIGDFDITRFESDKVKILFKEELLNIQSVNTTHDFTQLIQSNRVLLGIKDNIPTPLYMSKKEEGMGLINGNALIVGGSGSGKSWLVTQLLKNFLTPKNYTQIDKIYIINYKASADYNFIKDLDKVLYAEDIESGLKLLKMAYLDMITRYRYNSVHSQANFTQFQQLIIIDEVQTLNEMLDSKSLHKLLKNSISESLSLLEIMGSKIRASNGSLINILQKADISSLPSTAYRSNLRNRIMLKQENISSAHLVVNSDITEKNNINPLELKQGQFIYWDMLTNELQRGFAVDNKITFDIQELNNLPVDEKVQKAISECESYKEISIKTIEAMNTRMDKLTQEGKKTFYDSFEDLDKNGEIDMFEIVKEKKDIPIKKKPQVKNDFSKFLKEKKSKQNQQNQEKEQDFLDSIV